MSFLPDEQQLLFSRHHHGWPKRSVLLLPVITISRFGLQWRLCRRGIGHLMSSYVKCPVWRIDPTWPDTQLVSAVDAAATLLQQNQIVAFPTETVYGIGGNAFDDGAIGLIYSAKGRPADNPLIVHIGSSSQLADIALTPTPMERALMSAFWPGPLTLILRSRGTVSRLVSSGNTVAVRIPSNRIAAALLRRCALPIAAPSANTSGRPSPTRAAHVADDLSAVRRGYY